MSIMEIKNPHEVQQILEQVARGNRTSSPGTMMYIFAKFFFLFIGNIALLLLFIPSSWAVIKENKRLKEMNEQMFNIRSQNGFGMNQMTTMQTN